MVWYSHLFQNFPQFIVIHTVKGFGIVNKAEMFFWNSLPFSMIQWMLAIWSLVPLSFLKPAWKSGISRFTYCWSLAWRILSITLLACEMTQSCPILQSHGLWPNQAFLSIEFSRQEYWRRLPFPSPGDRPHPGIKPESPLLQADSLLSETPGNPLV